MSAAKHPIPIRLLSALESLVLDPGALDTPDAHLSVSNLCHLQRVGVMDPAKLRERYVECVSPLGPVKAAFRRILA